MGAAAVLLTLAVLAYWLVETPAAFAEDPESALGPPRNVIVELAENGRIVLTWDAPATDGGSEITGYRVSWAWESQGHYRLRSAQAGSERSHTIAGLSNGTEYSLRVAALNAAGERVSSTEVRATPRDTIAPRLRSAVVSAAQSILIYDGPLDRSSVPPTDAFSVMVSGSAREVTKVILDGKFVRLTLTSAATSGDAVSVSYAAPADAGATRVQDSWSNAVASFDDETATWAVAPGVPRKILVFLGGSRELRVYWADPLSDGGSAITGYRVQWKSGEEDYHPSRQAMAGGSELTYRVRGLTNGVRYTLRVVPVNAVGDGAPSAEASETPLDAEIRLRQFIAESIVEEHEADHPWLRATWEHMKGPGFDLSIGPDWGREGVVYPTCFNEGSFRKCRVDKMEIHSDSVQNTTVLLHEMAHVFTLTDDLLLQPAPWAAAQMYFAAPAFRGCSAEEILADVLALSVNDRIDVPYWRTCNEDYEDGEPDLLTEEALAVVKSATGGQVPRWFADTYNDTGGNPDLEKVWMDLKAVPASTYRDLVLYRFRDEFGGYCDNKRVPVVLEFGGGGITNPWRDGGCAPEAPAKLTAVVDTSELTLTWDAPANGGGGPIKGYRVEWKSPGEEYGVPRLTVVSDLSDLSHTITGLAGTTPHTLRVGAFNIFGEGAFSAEITTVPGSGGAQPHPVSASVNGAVITLTYEEVLDADLLPAAGAFGVHAGGAAVAVSDPSVDGSSISLTLARAVAYRQEVTLSYAAPEEGVGSRIQNAEGQPAASFGNLAVANETPPPPNRAPTGVPTISGTVQVGETLTADTGGIADEDGLTNVAYRYRWNRGEGNGGDDIEGATASTHELSAADAGQTITVRVSFTDDGGNPERLTSAATAVVATRPNIPATGTPSISGTAQVGETLTADTSAIADENGLDAAAFRYQWLTAGGDIQGATASAYELSAADVGQTITVRVSFTDDGGNPERLTSAATAAVAIRPNIPATGTPSISGTVQVGEMLTADVSGIADEDGVTNVAYSYRWNRGEGNGGDDIEGATASTHELSAADAGQTITVRVSFTDDRGNPERLTSAATAAVAYVGGPPGAPREVEVLAGDTQLQVSWRPPAEENKAPVEQYRIRYRDEGGSNQELHTTQLSQAIGNLTNGVTYRVQVTAKNTAGYGTPSDEISEIPDTISLWSADMSVVDYETGAIGAGTADRLTKETGSEGLEAKWLWYYTPERKLRLAFKTGIANTDGLTLTLGHVELAFPEGSSGQSGFLWEDVDIIWTDGQTVRTRINRGLAEAQPAVMLVNTAPTGLPAISGLAQVGETLTVSTSSIADADGLTNVSYGYQWIRNDGNTDADIAGETASTYTLVTADQGKTIKVRVSFTDDADHEGTLTSAATGVVAAKPNSPATGAPTIDGTARVGETLTVSTSSIADEDGLTNVSYGYRWIVNDGEMDTDIDRAAGSTYELSRDDVGMAIKVRVSFSDDAGNQESLTSAATDIVAATKPGVPGHLNVFPHDAGVLEVSWHAPASDGGSVITGYLVQWKESADGWETPADVSETPVTGTSHTITGLTEGVGYSVRVSAVNDVGAGPPSAGTSGTPQEVPLWSATLTVGTAETFAGYTTFLPDSTVLGALSSDTVTLDDASYTVKALGVLNGKLILSVLPKLTDGFVLVAGTDEFASTDASTLERDSSPIIQFQWDGSGLDWSDGEEVAVRLTQPDENSAATGTPTISGTAQVGETLTADTSAIADEDGLNNVSYNYQWMADDANIQHATGSTHTLTDDEEGKAIKVKISFADDDGNAESLTSQATDPVAPRPNRPATGAPSIQGVLQDLKTLTADTVGIADADGMGNATISYQWMRVVDGDAVDITGATGSTYTLTSTDVGDGIQLQVSFTDDRNDTESITSAVTTPIASSGATRELLLLSTMTLEDPGGLDADYQFDASADHGSLSPAAFTEGEDTPSITFLGASFGSETNLALELDTEPAATQTSTWRLALRNTELAFADATKTQISADTTSYRFQWDITGLTADDKALWDDGEPFTVSLLEAINLSAAGVPTISGTPQVNETLTASIANITDGNGLDSATYEYQWSAGGSDIAGATGASFTITTSQEGQTIQVRVDFEDDDGFSEAATSVATDTVAAAEQANNPATGLPTISGTPQVEQTLTADTSAMQDADGLQNVNYQYQWLSAGTAISGATGSTYTLTANEQGDTIQVRVDFEDDAGNRETLTSVATDPVAAAEQANTAPTGLPSISGTAQVGETLTASTSNIDDEDGLDDVSYRYQWVRNDGTDDADIAGGTGSTYTLVDADEGRTIRVKVSFTDDANSDESLTSAPTETVLARANRAAAGLPTISGTPQVEQTLTADTSGISDEDGIENVSYAYQWLAGGTAISGATGSSYQITSAEQGKTVQVRVTFSDDRNNSESLTSVATEAVAAKPVPLTATFSNVPDSHSGSGEFTFDLTFSENFPLSYRALRDHAFTEDDHGPVTRAQRKVPGSNQTWTITVEPSGNGVITITLPATTDCNATSAICTSDGRKLSNSNSVSISGPS